MPFESAVGQAVEALSQQREAFSARLQVSEVGTIIGLSSGIATISGLPGVGFEELVRFPGQLLGMAFNIDADQVSVVLLGDYAHLQAGDEVERTGRVMDIGVGEDLLGRVVDPLGRPLDGKAPPHCEQRLPIERSAKAILDRAPVVVPLQTGIKVVDALVPIGRGQRELILGDRQTGKTTVALGAILNQQGQNVVCIYCAIGQRASAVARVIAELQERGAMDYTVVMMSHGDGAPGLSYVAPYAATSIGEYFMEAGRDVLIVYDDLTHHARSYREISLLLRRPPGREAYPGDIFYLHSRLLERATHLSSELGGGSLTALPVLETEAEDVSAYIPTNLISITDGQLYLSPRLFELGTLPAVDVAQSVSRVGGKAQLQGYREVAGSLKLAYSQFEELETFSRFGSSLDSNTRKVIDHGGRIRACLKQGAFEHVSVVEQICILLALSEGQFARVELRQMKAAQQALRDACANLSSEIKDRVLSGDKISDEDREALKKLADQALEPLRKPETEPKPKAEPEAKPKAEPEAKPNAEPEAKPKAEPEAKPKAELEAKPNAEPEAKPKAEPEPKP